MVYLPFSGGRWQFHTFSISSAVLLHSIFFIQSEKLISHQLEAYKWNFALLLSITKKIEILSWAPKIHDLEQIKIAGRLSFPKQASFVSCITILVLIRNAIISVKLSPRTWNWSKAILFALSSENIWKCAAWHFRWFLFRKKSFFFLREMLRCIFVLFNFSCDVWWYIRTASNEPRTWVSIFSCAT